MSSTAQMRYGNRSHPEPTSTGDFLSAPEASPDRCLDRARAHQPVLVEGLKNTGLPTLRQPDVPEKSRRCRALHGPTTRRRQVRSVRPAGTDLSVWASPWFQQIQPTPWRIR